MGALRRQCLDGFGHPAGLRPDLAPHEIPCSTGATHGASRTSSSDIAARRAPPGPTVLTSKPPSALPGTVPSSHAAARLSQHATLPCPNAAAARPELVPAPGERRRQGARGRGLDAGAVEVAPALRADDRPRVPAPMLLVHEPRRFPRHGSPLAPRGDAAGARADARAALGDVAVGAPAVIHRGSRRSRGACARNPGEMNPRDPHNGPSSTARLRGRARKRDLFVARLLLARGVALRGGVLRGQVGKCGEM